MATSYFLSPLPPPLVETCHNCVWLPTSLAVLQGRVTRLLGHSNHFVRRAKARDVWLPRKLMDLRPLLASLFPEVAQQHEWVGYTDTDIVLGNLSKGLSTLLSGASGATSVTRTPLSPASSIFNARLWHSF